MAFKYFPATLTSDNTKVPLINDWYDLATDDPNQIQKWINQYGPAITFWGLPTGSKNNIVAVDIDVKTGKDGFKSIKDLGYVLPDTMTQTTMNGGRHYIYKIPEGLILKNTVGSFGDGIDTRGEKGWVAAYHLSDTPLAEAPAWLLFTPNKDVVRDNNPFIIEPTMAREMLEDLANKIVNAPPGEANSTMNLAGFAAAQNLIGTGSLSKEEVYEKLFKAGKERGKGDYEIQATLSSAFDGGSKVIPNIICPFDEADKKPLTMIFEEKEVWTPKKMTPEQLYNRSKLRRPQLFKGWSTEDIHITTADGGVGKTTLKLYEAVCLALGERFLGFECVRRGNTLFITGEDEDEKLIAVIGMICEQMKLTADQMNIVMNSVYIKKDADLCVVARDKSGFYNPNHNALNKILEACKEINPKMIVLDPIASFWGSEAALNDMSKAVAKFAGLLVSKTNTCVEMLNHMGKSSSQNKDVSQFAGRGGSALPSHSRVSRVMRKVDANEFAELAGKPLDQDKKALLCVVNKFTDGSDLLDAPFIVLRTGFLFEHVICIKQVDEEPEELRSDVEIMFDYIKECRVKNKYPTRSLLVAALKPWMSKDRVTGAIQLLIFDGYNERKIKLIPNVDPIVKEQMITFTNMDGDEL